MKIDDEIKKAREGNETSCEVLRSFATDLASTKGIGKVDKVGTRRLLLWLSKLSQSDKALYDLQWSQGQPITQHLVQK